MNQETPAGYASADERRQALQLLDLKQAILRVVDQAPESISQAARTAVVAEALVDRELFADRWCPECQGAADGLCPRHSLAADVVDQVLAHEYANLPGGGPLTAVGPT